MSKIELKFWMIMHSIGAKIVSIGCKTVEKSIWKVFLIKTGKTKEELEVGGANNV